MLRSCRSLAAAYFFKYAAAAQSGAGMSRLVFHASIVFQCPEHRSGFAKSDTHPCADCIQLLTFECQNVCQKGFNTIIHRICPDVVPELSGALTVGRATADYPAMGFNKRKMEDARRQEAEIESAARRATEKQIVEDALAPLRSVERAPGQADALAVRPDDWRRAGRPLLVPVGTPPGLPHHACDRPPRGRPHPDAAVTRCIPALSRRSWRPMPFAELVRLSLMSIADEIREEH
jgi:hypothetical protein